MYSMVWYGVCVCVCVGLLYFRLSTFSISISKSRAPLYRYLSVALANFFFFYYPRLSFPFLLANSACHHHPFPKGKRSLKFSRPKTGNRKKESQHPEGLE